MPSVGSKGTPLSKKRERAAEDQAEVRLHHKHAKGKETAALTNTSHTPSPCPQSRDAAAMKDDDSLSLVSLQKRTGRSCPNSTPNSGGSVLGCRCSERVASCAFTAVAYLLIRGCMQQRPSKMLMWLLAIGGAFCMTLSCVAAVASLIAASRRKSDLLFLPLHLVLTLMKKQLQNGTM